MTFPRANANGVAQVDVHVDAATLATGQPSDIVGTALVVHEKPDDYKTQPAGNCGNRIACAVIKSHRVAVGPGAVTAALLAFVHHALAFGLVAVVTVELVLLKGAFTAQTARSILRMDALYGLCAGLLLVIGFLRVFYTEKGAAYYFASAPFIAKISLFAAVGLISIYPTMQFLGWRKALAAGSAPVLDAARVRSITRILHIELTLLLIIMLCAALMARGIGFLS